MNIQTATPAEIDTELAAIYKRGYQADAEVAQVVSWIKSHSKSAYARPERLAELEAKLEQAKAARTAIWTETTPYAAEFKRRGGWTRFFLVDNAGGHVHSSMDCNTCYATTQFAWLPEYSGQNEAGVVELAGESACTVCFPSAPVDVLKRASRIESPDRKAARLEREAAAAAKAARKAVNEIPAVVVTGVCGKETIVNKVTATTWCVDQIVDEHIYEGRFTRHADEIAAVVVVLAAKDGVTEAAKMAEIEKKAAAKIRKFDKEAAQWAAR